MAGRSKRPLCQTRYHKGCFSMLWLLGARLVYRLKPNKICYAMADGRKKQFANPHPARNAMLCFGSREQQSICHPKSNQGCFRQVLLVCTKRPRAETSGPGYISRVRWEIATVKKGGNKARRTNVIQNEAIRLLTGPQRRNHSRQKGIAKPRSRRVAITCGYEGHVYVPQPLLPSAVPFAGTAFHRKAV